MHVAAVGVCVRRMLTFLQKLPGKNSLSYCFRESQSILQADLISYHANWLPGSLGLMLGNTEHYRTWSPRSLILYTDCQHSCPHWYTHTQRILSTWAQAHNGLDSGKVWGMLITYIGIFNCKECQDKKTKKAAGGFERCRMPKMPMYMYTCTHTQIHKHTHPLGWHSTTWARLPR